LQAAKNPALFILVVINEYGGLMDRRSKMTFITTSFYSFISKNLSKFSKKDPKKREKRVGQKKSWMEPNKNR
jgi:hypothetical protein